MENLYTLDAARKLDFSGYYIPEHTRGALERYFNLGYEPGSFLMAVLCNDLYEAVGRADDQNIEAIPSIVRWLYNRAPRNSYGSPERVADYITKVRGN